MFLKRVSSHQFFVFFAMLCGFFICMEYAIIRPVSNSIFISYLSSSFLPYAWLLNVPFNLFIVALYNRYLPRIGCLRMFLTFVLCVITINIACALSFDLFPRFLPLFFYIWKEVYIMLMFQQLWSVIHSAIDQKKARYLYGILFGIGGMGGLAGSMLPGYFAVEVGSCRLIYLTLPLYVILFCCFALFLRYANRLRQEKDLTSTDQDHKKVSIKEAFGLIRSSRILSFILMIVICMQLTASLVDFQFSSYLENSLSDQDQRTEYAGKVFAIMNFLSIILQIFGAYVVVRFLGLRKSHFTVPLLLFGNACGLLVFPLFGVASYCFIAIKAIDHSIFGVLREMLYIPLKPEEKFQAKAVIDVFAYRTSKGLASFLLLALQALAFTSVLSLVTVLSMVIFLLWAFAARAMLREREAELSL